MDSPPEVSVVVPAYNRAGLIQRAIGSVLDQTFSRFELIVVDDASKDSTAQEIERFGDPRIHYFRHDVNRGGGAARNTGIRAAKGLYVAFLDSDDEWLPQKLSEQVAAFGEGNERLGLVYTAVRFSTPHGDNVLTFAGQSGMIFRSELFRDRLPPTSAVMVRRQCFETAGLFDEALPARQDYDMWIRICRDWEVTGLKEPLVRVHVTGADRVTNSAERLITGTERVVSKIRESIAQEPEPFRRSVLSSQYADLARRLLSVGDGRQARAYAIRSLKYAVSTRAMAVLLVSLGGRRVYRSGSAIAHLVRGRASGAEESGAWRLQ